MKRHKKKASSEVHLGFQIAPMVDVVFVIMLFFMVLAGSVKVENAHNIKLPGTVETDKAISMPEEQTIRIQEDGVVLFNDDEQNKDLQDLTGKLMELKQSSKASNSEVLITITADPTAEYRRVVDVFDSLSQAEISNVTFQAVEPEQ